MSKWVVGGNFKNIRVVITDVISDDSFAIVNMPRLDHVEWEHRDGELYATAYFSKLKDSDIVIVRNVAERPPAVGADSRMQQALEEE